LKFFTLGQVASSTRTSDVASNRSDLLLPAFVLVAHEVMKSGGETVRRDIEWEKESGALGRKVRRESDALSLPRALMCMNARGGERAGERGRGGRERGTSNDGPRGDARVPGTKVIDPPKEGSQSWDVPPEHDW
jgi:hypothetical protein